MDFLVSHPRRAAS